MNWFARFRQPSMPTGGRSLWSKVVVGVLALVVVFYLFLTWWWDKELPLFDPASEASARASIADQQPVVGYTTTATLVHLIESLLDKRGGYLSNDIAPPGLWMDNIPNWEFGALVQIRDMGRSLRIDFSRSQSQSNEDPNLAEAEGKFFLRQFELDISNFGRTVSRGDRIRRKIPSRARETPTLLPLSSTRVPITYEIGWLECPRDLAVCRNGSRKALASDNSTWESLAIAQRVRRQNHRPNGRLRLHGRRLTMSFTKHAVNVGRSYTCC